MKRSFVPVILVVAIAALCLSAMFAVNDNQTEGGATMQPLGSGTSYSISGHVTEEGSSPAVNIVGATVTLSSDTSTASGTTDSDGNYNISVIPGDYTLSVTKIGYQSFTVQVSVSADVTDKDISMTPKTSVNGATVTGYVMALDEFARYSSSSTDRIQLYYRTTEEETSVFSDYKEIQFTSTINIANGTFEIDNVMYSGTNDTLIDRCYIGFSINNYGISNYSSACIDGSITLSGSGGKDITLYHLNKNISETGSFEENGTYSLGDSSSAGMTFSPIDGTISGKIRCNTENVVGATVTLSSETAIYSTISNAEGKYTLYIVPGTYELTVSKAGYVTLIEKNVKISENISKDILISEKTQINGSTITGYFMSLDEALSSEYATNIELYYRITATESSSISDYVKIGGTSTIKSGSFSNGTFEITGVKYDAALNKDTLVDRCYLMISIGAYSVASVSSTYFTGEPIKFTDSEGVITVLYKLNESISETGSFEDNVSYRIGNDSSAGIILEHAKGTIWGTMGTSGTVTVTDSTGKLYGQGAAGESGNYSFESYVGKDLNISYSSTGYKGKTLTVTVYDDNVNPKKNEQTDVKLTEIETGKAYIKVYIDAKTSNISDIENGKYVLYQLLNPSEKDPSKHEYKSIGEYNAPLIKDVVEEKINGYYFEFNINGSIDCKDCFLSIQISGYSVRTVQSEFMEMTPTIITSDDISTNQFKSAISTNGRFEIGHEYSIGSCSSDAILIDSATGTVKGEVLTNTDNPTKLNGVKVSIIDKKNDSVIAYGITSNGGNYSITVASGEYMISYEIEGYVTYESTVKVYDESIYDPEKNRQPTVKLDEVKGEWFGLDLPHALLVLGGIIAAILICVVLYHRFRVLGKKKKVLFVDEEEDEKK